MLSSQAFKREVFQWANELQVKPKEIHLRPMKKKWASCSSKGRLSFNTELLELSQEKRKEIIIHELLHLRYPNHGKMFQLMLQTYQIKTLE